jgi:PAS domain S-box-containing protein
MLVGLPSAFTGDEGVLDMLRRVASGASMGLLVTVARPDGKLDVFADERAEQIIGRTTAELNQIDLLACFGPEAQAGFAKTNGDGGAASDSFETVVVRPGGARVPIHASVSRLELNDKTARVAFLSDLNPQRRAAEALRESEERFRTVVQNAPDGVAILRDRTILYLNERAATLLGLPAAAAGVGRQITEFLSPVDAALAQKRIGKIVNTGRRPKEPQEYRSIAANGREVSVEISSIPIDLDGERAILAFARDVTERKAIQARLAQADRLAALGVLSAGVAHEINNPLSYVLLNLEFVERELRRLPDPERRETLLARVNEAKHGAERVATIVRDLKTFARGDEALLGPVLIEPVIESALNGVGSEIRKRASVERRFERVPTVHGNAARLEQVFVNLLLNAAQAIPDTGYNHRITVALAREETMVRVTVSDTGSGIADDVLDRIFDPFFTTKPPGVGTGLGLPICRGIVSAHGGELTVTSRVGQGSTFTLRLPIHQGGMLEPAQPAHESHKPATAQHRVLVVDDEIAVGRTLSLVLEPEYEVTVAESAEQALSAIRDAEARGGFDAVICDLLMPGMTGIELFEITSREFPDLAPRFIFMSGGLSLTEPRNFSSRVSNRIIEKPFDLSQIRTALRELVATE